jgi:hypothetical protein
MHPRTATREVRAMARVRRFTVLRGRRLTGSVPVIHFSGHWLREAGFLSGCRLLVKVSEGRLVVEVVAPPDPAWWTDRGER